MARTPWYDHEDREATARMVAWRLAHFHHLADPWF